MRPPIALVVSVAPVAVAMALMVPARGATAAGPAIRLKPAVGPPTTTVTIHGSGFGASEPVQVWFGREVRATGQTGSDGSFAVSFDVPKGVNPGPHEVKAKGLSSGAKATATFIVRTDWPQFRFDPNHSGTNPYENVLSRKNVGDLKVLWRHRVRTSSQSSLAVVGGAVYASDQDRDVYALDATTGTQLWRFTASGNVIQAVAAAGGLVFVSSTNGVDAVDAGTGTLRWHFSALGCTSVTVAGGVVYFGSYAGSVYALDAATGSKLWSFPTQGHVESTPAVVANTVYVGSDDGRLYTLNASTGAVRWAYATAGYVRSSPSVVDGVVYVGSDDAHVYALNASNGKKIWRFAIEHQDVESSPAVSGGVVYIGADQDIYALAAATGTVVWKVPILNVNIQSSPAVANGVVYIGSIVDDFGALVALDAGSGSLLWYRAMDNNVNSSPTVVNGIVYLGSPDAHIYAFAP